MSKTLSWLDSWLARIIATPTAELPPRQKLEFQGFALTDDATNDRTIIADATALKMAGAGSTLMSRVVDIAHLQTTNATTSSIYEWPVLDEATTLLRVEVIAARADGGKGASFVRYVRIRSDGGVVTLGTPTNPIAESDASFGVTINVDASGTTGRVRVTGLAATTIEWSAWIERFEGAAA